MLAITKIHYGKILRSRKDSAGEYWGERNLKVKILFRTEKFLTGEYLSRKNKNKKSRKSILLYSTK